MAARTLLRPAEAADAAAAADVWLRSYDAALPTVRRAHDDDDVRRWVRDVLLPSGGVTVAEQGGVVLALLAESPGWVDQLYVDPAHQGRGTGSLLLRAAQQRQPDGLQLWTFQVNEPALRFYARHGFVEVERTDGAANEEREPDVRLGWALRVSRAARAGPTR